jgi:hypothetical protein
MAVTAELQIYKTMQSLSVTLCELTKNFAKDFKVTIGQQIILLCTESIALLSQANNLMHNRTECLNKFVVNIDILRSYMQLCEALHLITDAQRVTTFRDFDSVSRQASGWLKASKVADKSAMHDLAVEVSNELKKILAAQNS